MAVKNFFFVLNPFSFGVPRKVLPSRFHRLLRLRNIVLKASLYKSFFFASVYSFFQYSQTDVSIFLSRFSVCFHLMFTFVGVKTFGQVFYAHIYLFFHFFPFSDMFVFGTFYCLLIFFQFYCFYYSFFKCVF